MLTIKKQAIDLQPGDKIVGNIDKKNKVIEIFPVWSVSWCKCWEHDKVKNKYRHLAKYKKDGKIQYDPFLGIDSGHDFPHSFYCNKPESGRLSPSHIRVAALNYDMMSDIGVRSYNKTNTVEVLLDKGTYKLDTYMYYLDMAEVIEEWQKPCDEKTSLPFEYAQIHLDNIEKFTSAELMAIIVEDANSNIHYLRQTPDNGCSNCFYKFEIKGIDPYKVKKITLNQHLVDGLKLHKKFSHIDDVEKQKQLEREFDKVIAQARQGKLSRLEYIQIFNGNDAELI